MRQTEEPARLTAGNSVLKGNQKKEHSHINLLPGYPVRLRILCHAYTGVQDDLIIISSNTEKKTPIDTVHL